MAAGRIPATHDALFRTYGASLPLSFLRGLAWNESRMDARAVSRAGARGILQIMPVVLSEFNRANGTSYARDDLHRPDVNVAMAAWLLRVIVRDYARHHPRTLATNWDDPRFVGLVVLGWNRGFSERAGVGYVVGRLEAEGWPPRSITTEAVVANAARFGAARTLQGDLAWVRSVVAAHLGRHPGLPVAQASAGGGAGLFVVALAVGTAVVYARRSS